MNKAIEDVIDTATKSVNAAVAPYGFHAKLMDTIDEVIGGRDVGEVWFNLWYDDEEKQQACKAYFQAIYYFKPNSSLKRDVGDIGFGIMENDFIDLPSNPKVACAVYDKYSQQMTLEEIIAECEKA